MTALATYSPIEAVETIEMLHVQVAALKAQVKQLQIENEQLKTRILNSTEK